MTAVLALAVGMCFTSCKKEEDDTTPRFTITENTPFEFGPSLAHDTSAAYGVAFKLSLKNNRFIADGVTVVPTDKLPSGTMRCNNAAKIADYGKVRNLDKITKYPSAADFSDAVNTTLEHGYVLKVWGSHNVNAYSNPAIHDPDTLFFKFYVEKEADGGYTCTYEQPFVEEK